MRSMGQTMKIRLMVMGCILSALSGILIVVRGFETAFFGLLIVGVVLIVIGLLWKSPKKST
jgi:uncharacterized membrane protein